MAHKLTQGAWKRGDLNRAEKVVFVRLCDHVHRDGDVAWPSIRSLADDTGYSDRSVQRSIQSLQAKGYIVPVQNLKGGRGNTVRYQIVIEGSNRLKGETMSPFSSVKGEALSPFSGEERVTSTTSKGDICALKGDIHDNRTYMEPERTVNEPVGSKCSFDEFYGLYPRKEGKLKAHKAFDAAVRSGVTPEELIAAVRRYNARIAARGTIERYHPMPERWLTERRWEDDAYLPTKPPAPASVPSFRLPDDAPAWKLEVAQSLEPFQVERWIHPLETEIDGSVCRVLVPDKAALDRMKFTHERRVRAAIRYHMAGVEQVEFQLRAGGQ